MSDPEDYTAVFFQECDELLDDLEDHLASLADGADDPEIINAAFRAVHSIKGGADAFGYRDLVGFAHVFEATMDAIRAGRLAVSAEVSDTLVRGRDVLCDLVEAARAGGEQGVASAEEMTDELAALSGKPAERGGEKAPAPAAQDEEAAITPVAPPSAAGGSEDGEDRVQQSYLIRFAPGPDFQRSGHDALRVTQSLRALGAVKVTANGEIPPLSAIDPEICPLAWDIELHSGAGQEAVDAFFDIYRGTAEISVETEGGDEDAAAPAPAAGAGEPKPAAQAQPEAPAAPAKPARAEESASGAVARAPRTLRVDLDRVDRLVNMVGEIVITQAAMAQTLADQGVANLELGHAIDAMSRQIRELQESVMAIRAQPVKGVFSRMSRLVRDLAQQLEKEVRAEISGEQTEVDTTVIEELAEPLIHMVRNAMDHGIETPEDRESAGKPRQGLISISAEHRGERVVITLADDGRGIDRDRVLAKAVSRDIVEAGAPVSPEEIDQLIFHPGLSTKEAVSNVSGRGVGMDVVKRNIQALGGRVQLENWPGRGTRITITLPLSLAVLDGMTVVVGDQRFVIPLSAVVEALTLTEARPHELPGGARVMVRREQYLPLLSLHSALGVDGEMTGGQLVVVVDADADERMGLLVDELVGQRQVVLKSLEANYRGVTGISGATILSDGGAALILDVPALRNLATSGMHGSGMPTISREYVQ